MESRNRKPLVPVWEKYMMTIEEAAQYFNIGEKRLRMLANEYMMTEFNFTVMVGTKVLINRKKFEAFLNQTSSV